MKYLPTDKPMPLLLMVVFAGIIWGGQYTVRDLWNPDEARYTYVAQEMDQSGSWLIPMRNGETYAHKPPLMFWLIKAGTFLTGGQYNSVSGRLPTFLGVILSLWVISRLSLMWFDARTAWRTFFILSTSSLFWLKAGTGQIDMLLLGLELMALYFLFTNETSPSPWRPVFAFSFMGLAILAKGPVGVIIPTGIYICANLFYGKPANIKKTYWVWGILLALAWPAAWLLAAKVTGGPPAYFDELLFKQNIGRVTGSFASHVHPFYYYMQYLIIDFMPWIFFIPVSFRVLQKDADGRRNMKRLVGWMLFVIVFFSLCSGKRNLYILSVYPAAAMIVAAAWPQLKQASAKWVKSSMYPLVFIMSLLAVAGVIIPLFVDLPFSGYVLLPVSLAMGAGAFFLIQRYRRIGLDQGWLNILVAVFILAELSVGMIVFPSLNPIKTPQALAREAGAFLQPDQRLLLFRINGEIYAFYSHRRGQRIDDIQVLERKMQAQGKGIVVFSERNRRIIEKRFNALGPIQAFRLGKKDVYFLKFNMAGKKLPGLSSLRSENTWICLHLFCNLA